MIYIASDHAGFVLKKGLLEQYSMQYGMVDLGPDTDLSVDYPVYAKKVAFALRDDSSSLGILICGSGVGMAIAANRFSHIRAFVCHSPDEARLAREHNNVNVISFGARVQSLAQIESCLDAFFHAKYSQDSRHDRRLAMLYRRFVNN